jgi:hypothetical protein
MVWYDMVWYGTVSGSFWSVWLVGTVTVPRIVLPTYGMVV